MRKKLFLFLTTFITLTTYSQIVYEKGYYVDNSGQRTECLIKNIDWKNNPESFEYKTSENNDPQTGEIESVKEFGIHNGSKFTRETVKIDRSSKNINRLSEVRNPKFNEEELFLKVLVEGKANLYEYSQGSLKRYFYSKEDSGIEQLVFKSYRAENNIRKNYEFRQQLWNNLQCTGLNRSSIKNLDYKKSDLVNFFSDYSECHGEELIFHQQNEKRDLFNLSIRPRINSSSLTVYNAAWESRIIDFGNKTNYGIGLEAEFVLPFNKNKWSILVEPTYQYFKAEYSAEVTYISGGHLSTEINYESIEFPVGVRHSFFLNNNYKIFVNAFYIYDLSSKSSIEFSRNDGSTYNSLEIDARNNLAMGIGFQHNNKISIEARYHSSREILGNYMSWNSDYETLSLIFGYSLF